MVLENVAFLCFGRIGRVKRSKTIQPYKVCTPPLRNTLCDELCSRISAGNICPSDAIMKIQPHLDIASSPGGGAFLRPPHVRNL